MSNNMDWKWEVIWKNLSPETIQFPSYTKEQIFASIQHEWAQGEVKIYGIEAYRAVVLVRPQSEFVGEVHIFSDSPENWGIVKAFKRLIAWGWKNTHYMKLEMRTHDTKVCALARRLGFKQEGLREKSFVTNSGEIKDEFEYGLVKPGV